MSLKSWFGKRQVPARRRARQNNRCRFFRPSLEALEPRVLLSVANEFFVHQAYRDLLGREAEPAGLNFWSGLLDRGLPPTGVVQGIDHSREYRTKEVESLYSSLLLRPADATGLDSWVGALEAGASRDQVTAGFLSSREYFQTRAGGTNSGFLAAVYHNVLGRPIDPVGAAGWSALLGGGSISGATARWFVAFGVAGSSEARQDFVQALYPQFLHRPADVSGLQNFVAALNGGVQQEQVLATVVGSDEYFLKVTQSLPGRAALAVPGAAGQAPVPATFTMLNYKADYHSEMDFFPVDDGQGRIGSLLPGSPGYAAAALARPGRRVVFGPYAPPGAVQTLSLPAGSFGGLLLVQNSTSDQLLAHNSADQLGGNPLAFFIFAGANPDAHFDHVRQPAANVYGFEDQTGGGDQDFIDRVVRVDFPPDVTPPVVTLTSPAPGLVTRTEVTVQGNATDDLTSVLSVQAKLDNSALFNVNFDSAGNFSFPLHLPLDASADGTHTVFVRATDGAGKTSEFVADSFTLDTTPPVIQLTSPPRDFKTRQNVTITGQVTDNLSGVASLQAIVARPDLRINIFPVDVPFDAAGNFSFNAPLANFGDGLYTVTLFAADRAGNKSNADTSFVLDTTPPVVTFTSPAPNLVTNKDVTVSGRATDDLTGVVSIQAKLDSNRDPFFVPLDSAGNFSLPVTLPHDGSADGPHTVLVSASDGAGNTASQSVSFTLDTTAPVISVQSPPPGFKTRQNVTITGQVTDALSGVASLKAKVDKGFTLIVDHRPLIDVPFDAAGHFSFPITLPLDGSGDGVYRVTLIAADRAGNESNAGTNFLLDTTPPVVTFTSPSPNLVTNKDVTISGQATDDLTGVVSIQVKIDGVLNPPFSLQFDTKTGNFSFPFALPHDGSADGPHTAAVSATDGAGNVSDFVPITFTWKTKPPPVTFDLDPAFVSSSGPHQTSFATVTLDGHTDPNLQVSLSQGVTALNMAHADASGNFQFTGVNLQMGANAFTVTATDDLGNQGTDNETLTRIPPQGCFASLDGWTVQQQGGSASGQGTVTLQNMDAVMQEGDSFLVTLSHPFTVAAAPSHLEIMFSNLLFDTTKTSSINDAFEAAFLDSSGNTLVHTIGTNRDAFFNITQGSAAALGSEASLTGNTVDLDLSGIFAGTTGTLVLRLVNNNQDPGTSVQITCVQIVNGAGTHSSQAAIVSPPRATHVVFANFSALPAGPSQGSPGIVIDSPANGSALPASTTLLFSGHASAGMAVSRVTINGRPVDALDAVGNFFTRVTILPGQNNFTLAAIDAGGTTASTTLTLTGTQLPPGAIDFSQLTDVSASFTGDYARTSFDDTSSVLYADLAIRNIGQYLGDTPLLVGITHLSNPDVHVRNADGLTPGGMPVYDLSSLVASGTLKPGGETGFRPASFFNRDRKPFTYDLVFLGRLNQPPAFTSVPALQAVEGIPYSYAAAAADPDGDTVKYSLTMGPAGMTVDPKTGMLAWSPGASDLGTQNVVLRADDGRGAFDVQQYVLSVIAPPPNLPPVFTSTPVVDANVNTPYKYQATAQDSDGDPLRFSLLPFPFAVPLTIDNPGFGAQMLGSGQSVPNQITGWSVFNFNNPTTNGVGVYHPTSQQYPPGVVPGGNNVAYSQGNFIISQGVGATLTADTDYTLQVDVGWALDGGPTGGPSFNGARVQLWAGGSRLASAPQTTLVKGQFVTYTAHYHAAPNDPLLGNALQIRLDGSDFTNVRLTAMPPIPTGMTIDAATGLIQWTPDANRLGMNHVAVQVSDGRGGIATQTYDLNVREQPSDHPPFITSQPVTSAVLGVPYAYQVRGNDADNDPLTFSLAAGPDGMTIDPATGNLTWSPGSDSFRDDAADHKVTVRVDDGHGGFDTQTFTLTVPNIPVLRGQNASGEIHGTIFNDQSGTGVHEVAGPLFLGPLPYLGKADSPFDLSGLGKTFFLDDFEHEPSFNQTKQLTQAPGVTVSTSFQNFFPQVISDLTPGDVSLTDSVDEDDGVIDGQGGTGHSLFAFSDIMFTFTPDSSGALPTRAGIVQTDVRDTTLTLEAFDRSGNSRGTLSFTPRNLADGNTAGNSFLGVVYGGGIGAIKVFTPASRPEFMELDHLQYGQYSQGVQVPSSPPLPNWVVYLDLNHNGKRDPGDPFTTTDQNGNFTFRNLAPGTYTVAEEGQPGWTQTAPIGGTRTVTVHAIPLFDGGGGTTLGGGEIVRGIEFGNQQTGAGTRAPAFTITTPPAEAPIGQLYRYVAAVSNPDGRPLTFDLPVKPDGMVVDPESGIVVWQPTGAQAGMQNVILRVRDDRGQLALQPFQIRTFVNTPPVITSTPPQPAVLGLPYRYAVQAQDAERDPLTYQLDAAPGKMSIDSKGGTLTWTPAAADLGYRGAVLIDHPAGYWRLGEQSGTTATDASGNHLDGTYQGVVDLGQPGALAGDADTAVRFNAAGSAGGTGWVTVPDAPGLRPAQLTVEAWVNPTRGGRILGKGTGGNPLDGYQLDLVNSLNFGVNGLFGPAIHAQIPAGQWSYVVGTYDGAFLKLYVNGSLEDSLAYSLPIDNTTQPLVIGAALPRGFDPWSGSLDEVAVYDTALPAEHILNHYHAGITAFANLAHVTILVNDGHGGQARQAFDLPVVAGATNRAPVITSTPRPSIRIGGNYVYAVQASDPDGDPLTYHLVTAPAGMTIDADGVVSWQPTGAQLGINAVTLHVDDSRGGTASKTFTVNVVTQLSDLPPTIVSTPRVGAQLGQPYAYDAQATDPENDPFLWSFDAAPAGMSINPQLGTIRWTPTADQVGPQNVVLRVMDAQGSSALQSFTVSVYGTNLAPIITSTPPTQAAVGQAYSYAVQANDADGDPLTFALVAPPTGMTIDSATGLIQWTPTADQVGTQAVSVEVLDPQGGISIPPTGQGFAVVVSPAAPGQPPVITSLPALTAIAGSLYQYQVTANEPEHEAVHFALTAGPSDMSIDATTGMLQWTPAAAQAGQPAKVAVTATDTAGDAATQTFTLAVRTVNRPPVIGSQPVTTATAGALYSYDVQANDPDGDPLTYKLDTAPQGMTVDGQGRIRWSPAAADLGRHSVNLIVSDPFGATGPQPFTVTVGADTEAPKVSLQLNPNPVNMGTATTIVVSATDNVGVIGLMLTVGGNAVPLDPRGQAILTMPTVGQFDVVATATDAAGNKGTATASLQVIDPHVTGAPDITLPDLPNGGVITAPVPITGTVNDPNLLSFTLSVGTSAGGNFQQIAKGTTPVTNGVLGTLDPSMLANDNYILRLTATNTGGHVSTADTPFSVMGNLKLGNFTLAFTDMTVPVSGIPITVTRTYDTLQAGTSEDFGFGWRLEYRDGHLQTSVPKTGDEANGIFNPFRDKTRVYVTLPGGKREGFTFRPTKGFLLGHPLYLPHFVPDPGVTDTLTPPGEVDNSNRGAVGAFGTLVGLGGAITLFQDADGGYYTDERVPYNPADDLIGGVYVLTTKDGTKYTIDAFSGKLEGVTYRNGNTLTFTDAGISSSAGPAIAFQRDPQGRIVSVTDPMGHSIGYQYDAKGDLVAVTDRMNNPPTQFVYRTDRPHYLDHVIDPLGPTGVRSDYDDQGRLKQVTNADNQAVQVSYAPSHDTETVLDARNNPTVYEYDDRGNILSVTVALGGVTHYTYDANNNVLAKTDPSSHTTTLTYDNSGNILTDTDPMGNVKQFTYNANSQPLTMTDALGNTTMISYDTRGNQLTITDPTGIAISSTYDSSGKLISQTNPNGGTNHYSYDVAGHLVHQMDALGDVKDFTYDALGNRLTETATRTLNGVQRMLMTTYSYDANGRVTTIVDPLSDVTQIEYDALGQLRAHVDTLMHRTTYDYDPAGRPIKTTFPDGTTQTTVYDAAGNKIQETDQAGQVTTYQYDALNRLVTTIFPDDTPADLTDNAREQTVYDAAGNVIARIDANGNRTDFEYDPAGRLVLTTLPPVLDGATGAMVRPQLRTEYDAAGNRTAAIDADGHGTQFVYDAARRLTDTLFPDGTSTHVQYDAFGNVAAVTDQEGRTTSYGYDLLGRLVSVTLPPPAAGADSPLTTYSYDEAGNLLTQTDALHHTTHFTYDKLNRLVEKDLPMGQSETFAYDAVGNQVRRTDFNHATTTFVYDTMNRLVQRLYPDGSSVSFTYTPTGQRQTIVDVRGTTTYAYGARGQLLSRTDPDGSTIGYTYDAAGNETSMTVAAGTIAYMYDALNRMETVTDPGGGVTHYLYDPAGHLLRTELPNATIETRQYDDLNRLVFLKNTAPGGSVISSYQYTVSLTGQRTGVTEDTGRTVSYTYDSDQRLTQESIVDPVAGSRTIAYTYDAVGNRLTRTDSAEGETTYTYDANDRLLTETLSGKATNYTYDNNGNRLSRGSGANDQASYTWDFENRLVGANITDASGTQHVAYQYDADGNRVAQIVAGAVTRFLLDTNRPLVQVLAEYTPGGVVQATHTYGLRLIMQNRGGVMSFYQVDGLGSIRALTSALGAVTDRYVYDAFGRLLRQSGNTNNLYLFAGEQFDPNLGFNYLRARYYDLATGRFASTDPFDGILRQPITLHRYVYAGLDPVNRSDPTGRLTLFELSVVASIAATVATLQTYRYTGDYQKAALAGVTAAFAVVLVDVIVTAALASTAAGGGAAAVGAGGAVNFGGEQAAERLADEAPAATEELENLEQLWVNAGGGSLGGPGQLAMANRINVLARDPEGLRILCELSLALPSLISVVSPVADILGRPTFEGTSYEFLETLRGLISVRTGLGRILPFPC